MAMRNINGAAISITDQHKTRRRRSNNIIDRLGVLCGLFAMSSIATSASAMSKALRLSRRASFIGGVVSSRNIASPSISVANRSVIQSTDLESSVPASALLFPSSPPISSCALYMAGRGRNSNVRESGRPSSTASASAVASSTAQTSSTAADSGDKQKQSTQKRSKSSGKKNKKGANTGRLRLLPPLQPANEILSRAMRQTYQEVKDDMKIANQRRRTQKRGAQTIDLLCQKLCAPLKSTVQTYRMELKHMHPFEKVVMDLTVRARQKKDGLTLSTILDEIHEGRKEMLQLSKDWIFKIKNSQTARESHECTEEAKEQLGAVFTDLVQEPWSGVMELQKSLRNVPIVRLDCPAVVLVGAPNVGKSSIVRAISSGTPEVNNYPFTTRGMTLGHVQVFWESDVDVARGNVAGVSIPSEKQLVQERLIRRGVKTRRMKEQEMLEAYSKEKMDGIDDKIDVTTFSSDSNESTGTQPPQTESSTVSLSKKIFPISQLCQIMDSPGILRRDDPTIRNEMEELTLAAMAHLPTAVMYVMDLSGGAGDKCSSVEDQLILRRELRARFPRRPWIDVISKVDLGIVDGAAERLRDILEAEKGGSGVEDEDHYFIELSIKEGQGVDELRQEVMRMLGEVRVVLDAMAAMDERSARAV